jgi:hypothetical protein
MSYTHTTVFPTVCSTVPISTNRPERLTRLFRRHDARPKTMSTNLPLKVSQETASGASTHGLRMKRTVERARLRLRVDSTRICCFQALRQKVLRWYDRSVRVTRTNSQRRGCISCGRAATVRGERVWVRALRSFSKNSLGDVRQNARSCALGSRV